MNPTELIPCTSGTLRLEAIVAALLALALPLSAAPRTAVAGDSASREAAGLVLADRTGHALSERIDRLRVAPREAAALEACIGGQLLVLGSPGAEPGALPFDPGVGVGITLARILPGARGPRSAALGAAQAADRAGSQRRAPGAIPGSPSLTHSEIDLRSSSSGLRASDGDAAAAASFLPGACRSDLAPACERRSTFGASSPSQTVPWTNSLHLPAFDPALGRLRAVTLRGAVPAGGSFRVENLDPIGPCIGGQWWTESSAQVTFESGGFDLFQSSMHATGMFGPLAPFDGVLDFDGPSGETVLFSGTFDFELCVDDPLALRDFVAAVPGAVLTFTARTTPASQGYGHGCGALAVAQELHAGMELELTYAYCP